MAVAIHDFFDRETGTFSYLVVDADSGEAAIIDPVLGFDPAAGRTDTDLADRLLDATSHLGCRVRWIMETHAHADHLSAGDYLRAKTGAGIAIGAGIKQVREKFLPLFDLPPVEEVFDRLLDEGDRLPLGAHAIEVMSTPGHTSDSVTYLIADAAFVGDTVFPPAAGTARCDFPGGDPHLLYRSLKRIHQLPAATGLFFCHDYPADGAEPQCTAPVAESWAHNIHLGENSSEPGFVAMRRRRDAALGPPRLLWPSLQVNLQGGRLPPVGEHGIAFLHLPLNFSLSERAPGRS